MTTTKTRPGRQRPQASAALGASLGAILLGAAALAQGTGPGEDRLDLAATLHGGSELRVEVSVLPDHLDEIVPPPRIEAAQASIAGVSLGRSDLRPYPADGQSTAVLFLVDISNPARQAVVERNLEQVVSMVGAGAEHHRFGLATFAETLEIEAEIGSDAAAIEAAAQGVRAVGQRTELIRLGADAARHLAGVEADRKVIVLMSDGQAEDDPSVYPASHFAEAAKRAGVRVYALGFHPSREETFGKMRFIAEESGGALIRADRSYALPEAFLANPFAWPDAGGTLVFDAGPALRSGLAGAQRLDVVVETAEGDESAASVDVMLPDAAATEPAGVRGWLLANWPVAAAGGAALVLIAGVLAWLGFRRRARRAQPDPIAYLEFLDGQGTRWPMRQKSIKIGRNSDNDLQFKNDTVSAYHATIHLQRDGAFIITDLNSLNGVTVDGETVEIAELEDGAEFELGEVRCRFTTTGASAEGLLTGPVADRTLPEESE